MFWLAFTVAINLIELMICISMRLLVDAKTSAVGSLGSTHLSKSALFSAIIALMSRTLHAHSRFPENTRMEKGASYSHGVCMCGVYKRYSLSSIVST